MKMEWTAPRASAIPSSQLRRRFAAVLAAGSALLMAGTAQAQQISVKTLAGGPIAPNGPAAGFVDGNSLLESQFNYPAALGIDSLGNLWVADRDNGRLRLLDLAAGKTKSVVSGLQSPVDVAVDAADNLFVVTSGNGSILKFDRFGNPLATIRTGLQSPTALALDSSTNVYVTELGAGAAGGWLRRITPAGATEILVGGLSVPSGVEVLDNGQIAISSAGLHGIQIFDPVSGNLRLLAGGRGAGFTDGPASSGQFNEPAHLAKAPNGLLVVADTLNHRYRVVATNGLTTTLAGVAPGSWSSDYPGWEDGSVSFAEARLPKGVAIGRDGLLYTSEVHYHLIRQIVGATLGAGSGSAGGGTTPPVTNIVVTPPTITPSSGYFPMGQTITVSSPVPDVFYTTDGRDPTTNSTRVQIINNVGTIPWFQPTADLTSLRVRAFVGSTGSTVTMGVPSPANLLSPSRDVFGGPGSTVVVPLVLSLTTNEPVRSLQFRVEVVPTSAGLSVVSDQLRALSIITNDFVPVITAAQGGAAAVFSTTSYLNQELVPPARGLVVSFIGTNANMLARGFAVATMLAVPIPSDAPLGARYRINVSNISATSDGQQAQVRIQPGPSRDIIVGTPTYLVGDSSPGGWYNAGDFGDGELNNADVNNAFYAALGIRLPFPFSDVFDSMDAFPVDAVNEFGSSIGGDGEVRFLDWQLILQRSLRLDKRNFNRSWAVGGSRVPTGPRSLDAAGLTPVSVQNSGGAAGAVWVRQGIISADHVVRAGVSTVTRIPIRVKVAPGSKLSGLLFSAEVKPDLNAPALQVAPKFVPADGIPTGNSVSASSGVVGYGWDLGAFGAGLTGERLLGHIEITVPVGAHSGDCYSVVFLRADGSPDLNTQYDLETVRACVWVNTAPSTDGARTSDEWKRRFFGSVENVLSGSDVDADGDGVPNYSEFVAGTDPVRRESRLQLDAARANGRGVALRWLSAPGKLYVVEATTNLSAGQWETVADGVSGDGAIREVSDLSAGDARFYRIRVRP